MEATATWGRVVGCGRASLPVNFSGHSQSILAFRKRWLSLSQGNRWVESMQVQRERVRNCQAKWGHSNENCTWLPNRNHVHMPKLRGLAQHFDLKIPMRAVKLAHSLGQPCAIFVRRMGSQSCDAFGVIGATFRMPDWKTLILEMLGGGSTALPPTSRACS